MAAMKEMFRDIIQQVMEVEMDEELGRERCQRAAAENSSPNYRNGYSQKTVKTQLGEIDIRVPRDRKGNYEPKIIGKYDRNAEGMEDKRIILSYPAAPAAFSIGIHLTAVDDRGTDDAAAILLHVELPRLHRGESRHTRRIDAPHPTDREIAPLLCIMHRLIEAIDSIDVIGMRLPYCNHDRSRIRIASHRTLDEPLNFLCTPHQGANMKRIAFTALLLAMALSLPAAFDAAASDDLFYHREAYQEDMDYLTSSLDARTRGLLAMARASHMPMNPLP